MSGTERSPTSPIDETSCVFCTVDEARIAWSARLAVVIWDSFPVSPGHALVVPKRHVASWADLSDDEKSAIIEGVDEARARIRQQHTPDGYNIGFNDGPAAGQTVMHFHVHVIPRYEGDVPDPRGGVRWVLGDKAVYWEDEEE